MKVKLIAIVSITVIFLFAFQLFFGQKFECKKCIDVRLKIETVASKGEDEASKLALELDPWGNKYLLGNLRNDELDCKVILSFGSDGKFGGSEIHQKDIFEVFDCTQ